MRRGFIPFAFLVAVSVGEAATDVLTRSFDNARTGANTTETVFTPDGVLQRQLKRAKSLEIADDPRLEAQPLYLSGIEMMDRQKHNVVFVCSMGNNVYAFDADAPQGRDLIWKANTGDPYNPPPDPHHPPHGTTVDIFGINMLWGVLSTPVIDVDAAGGPALYLVNWVAKNKKPELQLHAVRLRDGQAIPSKPPLVVEASFQSPAGRTVTLHADQKQRAALLLVPLRGQKKILYIATAGGENPGAPNGWVVGYDVDTWKRIDGWVATPNTFGGGIWQGAQGPSADEEGNVYVMTGNGGWRKDKDGKIQDFSGKGDFAESFVKLNFADTADGKKLTVIDWFTPFADARRSFKDQDLGSGAPIVPPGTNIVLGAGKDGVVYIMDRNNMGKAVADFSKVKAPPIFFTYFPGPEFSPTGNLDIPGKTHHLHGSPVFWNNPDSGPMVFDWGENECLRAWTMQPSGKLSFRAKSAEIASAALANPSTKGEGGMPGGMLALTANGNQKNTGIVWATAPINGNANKEVVEGIVRAYDAAGLDEDNNTDGTRRLKLLWDSNRAKNDPNHRFAYSKFCPPFAVDGKLFVTTYGSWPDTRTGHGRVDVYMLQ